MTTNHPTGRDQLQGIAHAAMLQRGLLPDFSPAVIAETNRITQAAAPSGAAIRDLRGLLWASIDNDDSRDLDQLSVAEPAAGGAVKILVAIADVDALVKKDSAIDGHAWTNTTSVYTAAQIFPMLPEKLSTDLTSLAEGEERLAIVMEMVIAADGTVTASDIYRAAVLNRAKLAYNGVAAWLEGTAPAPARLAAVPGLDEQLRIQDRAAQALRRVRHAHGALRLETLEVRAVFEDGALADLLPDEKNRAKELIEDFMIAANGVTAKYLEKKGFPSLRRVLHTPKRWDRIVALAAESGERLPLTPDAAALDAFLAKRREADPARFPDLSLSVVKLLGSGEYALRSARPARRGALRTGRQGLHAFHGAEPPLSRPHRAAAVEGGARRATIAVQQRRAHRAGAPLHRAGGQRRQGGAPGPQVGRGAAPGLAHRRAVRWHRDRRVGQGNMGAHFGAERRRQGRPRLRGPRRR